MRNLFYYDYHFDNNHAHNHLLDHHHLPFDYNHHPDSNKNHSGSPDLPSHLDPHAMTFVDLNTIGSEASAYAYCVLVHGHYLQDDNGMGMFLYCALGLQN